MSSSCLSSVQPQVSVCVAAVLAACHYHLGVSPAAGSGRLQVLLLKLRAQLLPKSSVTER